MKNYGEKKPFPFWAKCLIIIALELVIALSILQARDAFASGVSSEDLFKHLTDAFFVPGILVVSFAILALVAGEGAFDALRWGITNTIKALIPGSRLGRTEAYGDYVMRKRGERKKGGVGFMFVGGAFMLLLSMIFMLIYFQVAE